MTQQFDFRDRFCVFTSGGRDVYVNLYSVESVIDTQNGSIVSLKSGADVAVDESANAVLCAILAVSDTPQGEAFRRACEESGVDLSHSIDLSTE